MKVPTLRMHATVLPEGGAPVDVWVEDGRVRFEGPRDAPLVRTEGAFLLAGLVDAHSHVSWPHNRGTPAHTASFMNANRLAYAKTGVALLRDMGSATDHVTALGSHPGLPDVHAAGKLLLRHEDWPFTPTSPDDLERVAIQQVRSGARWVKVFSDWSRDYGGRDNTGFTGEDTLTYPVERLRAAVDAVHAAGGRVAAHCFTHHGAAAAVEAGVDSLEHGWGVDEPLLETMARRRIAWTPLLGIAVAMREAAIRFREAKRVDWIEAAMERMSHILPRGHELGVTILAGTDWFPEVTVADEIAELLAFGLDADTALGAGSYGARAFLGEPGIADGTPANLILVHEDPRVRVATLFEPELVIIGGVRVDPSFRETRPRRIPWSERG